MKILIVSSSLNPRSRSQRLASDLKSLWDEQRVDAALLDLRELPLPFCDGGAAYGDPTVAEAKEMVEEADAIVFATPIYAYSVNAVLKNFIEMLGHSMKDKTAGFLCAAGGSMSYMSVLGFANSLMLDYRMIVLPRFVYAAGSEWEGDEPSAAIGDRLRQFAQEFVTLARKLAA